MEKKFILLGLFVMLFVPLAAAIWIEDINIDGTITANAGSRPPPENYTMNVSIINESNYTENFQYNLKDDESDFIFFLDDSGIASTNASCVYDSGYDVLFYVARESTIKEVNTSSGTPPITFTQGWQDFNITADPHPNRCPLNGTFTIWSEMD